MMQQSIYQHLMIRVVDRRVISLKFRANLPQNIYLPFADNHQITLLRYRNRVVRTALTDHVSRIFGKPAPDQDSFKRLITSRSRNGIAPVHELCRAAQADGFSIALVNDEPHWGSDLGGVQSRMLKVFEKMQNHDQNHKLIVFDATPFQIFNASGFARVMHRLGANYCGPNCWGGEPIDPTVTTKDVQLYTMERLAEKYAIPDFALISRKADHSAAAFARWLQKHNKQQRKPLVVTYTNYRRRIRVALREAIQAILNDPTNSRTRGIALRILPANKPSQQFLTECKLDSGITVIPYMNNAGQLTVEEAIEKAAPKGKYVVLVTGAARMADYFPQHCTHFIDLTDNVSNQPSLMQGSYGRMCGYGEPRSLIMNERAIGSIDAYIKSQGMSTMRLGKQVSAPLGGIGAPKMNIRLHCERNSPAMRHPLIASAIKKLQSRVIDHIPLVYRPDGVPRLRPLAIMCGDRFPGGWSPFWNIFNEKVLLAIENEWKVVLPDVGMPPRILRPSDGKIQVGGFSLEIKQNSDLPGFGFIGLRNKKYFDEQDYRTQGMNVKGKFTRPVGERDPLRTDKGMRTQTVNSARQEIAGGVQPQIWMMPNEKLHKWEVSAVVLRLKNAARGRRANPTEIYAAKENHWLTHHGEDQIEIVYIRAEEQAEKTRRRRGDVA